MTNDTKYGKNRNHWRKVYDFRRRKPIIQTFTTANANSASFSYDLQKVVRHRDFFILRKDQGISVIEIILAEYDEGLIVFNNVSEQSSSFNFTFSSVPDAVVLTVDPAPAISPEDPTTTYNTDNIIAFGISFTSTSLNVGLSAPYSGNIRYRAVYSSTGYPAQATSSLVPGSGTLTLSAGGVVVSNSINYTASFDALSSAPTLFYKTVWDTSVNSGSNVHLTTETLGVSTATGEISSNLTNKIYFIAVQ